MKRLFDHKHPWTILSILGFGYSIGVNHDNLAEDISSLTYEMNSILNNALASYLDGILTSTTANDSITITSSLIRLVSQAHQFQLKDLD